MNISEGLRTYVVNLRKAVQPTKQIAHATPNFAVDPISVKNDNGRWAEVCPELGSTPPIKTNRRQFEPGRVPEALYRTLR